MRTKEVVSTAVSLADRMEKIAFNEGLWESFAYPPLRAAIQRDAERLGELLGELIGLEPVADRPTAAFDHVIRVGQRLQSGEAAVDDPNLWVALRPIAPAVNRYLIERVRATAGEAPTKI